jgi:hypothetical protein
MCSGSLLIVYAILLRIMSRHLCSWPAPESRTGWPGDHRSPSIVSWNANLWTLDQPVNVGYVPWHLTSMLGPLLRQRCFLAPRDSDARMPCHHTVRCIEGATRSRYLTCMYFCLSTVQDTKNQQKPLKMYFCKKSSETHLRNCCPKKVHPKSKKNAHDMKTPLINVFQLSVSDSDLW